MSAALSLFASISVELILVALFIAIVVLSTMALSAIKTARSTSSGQDLTNYNSALTWLRWSIGIGYTLIGLTIIAIIVAIIAVIAGAATGVDEAVLAVGAVGEAGVVGVSVAGEGIAATEGATVGVTNVVKKLANGTTKKVAKIDTKSYGKYEGPGFLGFNYLFGGKGIFHWIERIILVGTSAGLLAFGITSAVAASYISKTSTRAGYSYAIWAAVLGITPLALIIIWFVANLIFVSGKKSVKTVKTV